MKRLKSGIRALQSGISIQVTMNLDLVLGLSCNNKGALACDQSTGLVAHTASGVLVLLNTKSNCQVKYFHLRKNCVSSACFSSDGRYVITGETGYRPAVRVWRIKDGVEVATLYGHEFGIKCVQFSPDMQEIISVGMEHDNVVNVWAWPSGCKIAANNILDLIKAVSYSECGTFFVTSGFRHIKFWYPKITVEESKQCGTFPNVHPLYGRRGILRDCKDHIFLDVACGSGASATSVFAVTRAGDLVILSAPGRHVTGHKNMVGMRGTCIKVHDKVLFVGFTNGDVHLFNATNLVHLGALPLPTFFRASGLNSGGMFTLCFNLSTFCLATAYKNASMCVWDLKDANNVKQKYVAVYHSDGVVSLDVFSTQEQSGARETMVTVSRDSTVRFWGVLIDKTVCYDKLNIVSTEDGSPRPEGTEHQTLLGSGAITIIKISPDLKFIATGNQAGRVCVYDKESLTLQFSVEAHTRGVTCLHFYTDTSGGHLALVSGGRDRQVQIMDATCGFHVAGSVRAHSSSITAVTTCQLEDTVCLVSTATDRTINLSKMSACKLFVFHLIRSQSCVSSPTDIALDHRTLEMAVGFQDGNIRVYELCQLQEVRAFPGCTTGDTQIYKVALDQWAVLLLCAASDKTINVLNFRTGQVLHTVTGHSKSVTGLVFTSNENHVISTSLDGCVFLWRLSPELLAIRQRIKKTVKGTRLVLNGPEARAVAVPNAGCRASNLLKGSLLARPLLSSAPPVELTGRGRGDTGAGYKTLHSAPPRAILRAVTHKPLSAPPPAVSLGRSMKVRSANLRQQTPPLPAIRTSFTEDLSSFPSIALSEGDEQCWEPAHVAASGSSAGSQQTSAPPRAQAAEAKVPGDGETVRSSDSALPRNSDDVFVVKDAGGRGGEESKLTQGTPRPASEHSGEKVWTDWVPGRPRDSRERDKIEKLSAKDPCMLRRKYRPGSPEALPGVNQRRLSSSQHRWSRDARPRSSWRFLVNAKRTEALENNKTKISLIPS
ncbi:hypothetical protein RRG08_047761 [Elysia crispata]|uniref:WD repeat domain 62 n=1 Tax=Elysia crispata TaxID=231223 RepID=A0AAE1A4V8_9GAST|nr:hypothetical protein RRG08_047761 [Elysia crispata]